MAKVYDPILCMMVEEKVSTKDASEVLQSKNGYTLGVNNGRLVIAFTYKGETLNNPHMWLGDATNKENMRKAVMLLEKFAATRDECPEGMTCDALQFKPNVKYWSDMHHRYLLFKGYNDATKKYYFEDFGDDKFYFTEEEAKRLKVKDSVSSIDEAAKSCDAKFKVEYSEYPGSKKNITYVNAKTETEAANAVKGVVYNVVRISDKRSIDEAIRMCDKDVSFPSEKEAIEYCKENGIDPHKIKTIGDKYVVSE